jgi:AcrR family transcriptional regulator
MQDEARKTTDPPRHRMPPGVASAPRRRPAALLADQGYAGTSVDAICREAGVNKAMVSYHFGGKAGLHGAILIDLLDPIVARLGELAAAPIDPEAKLRGYFQLMLELHPRSPPLPADGFCARC